MRNIIGGFCSLLVAGLMVSTTQASTLSASTVTQIGIEALSGSTGAFGLNLAEGDEANYSMDMGFIQGSMQMLVRKFEAQGVWIDQNVNMGGFGQQKIEVLLDPATGEIKQIIANGQQQQIPQRGNMEVVETREETISVPAGTYTCVYIKVLDKSKNQEAQQWVNLRDIPVFGMVKSIAQSNFGPVTLQLTSFTKK